MGVENSCEIKESEMNPATVKLCALADVVTKLMLKNRTYEWEAEIQNLPCQLESISVEEILQVSSCCLIMFSANVTEWDVYPRFMRGRVEIVGQCSQQDCLSRYQILLCSLLKDKLIGFCSAVFWGLPNWEGTRDPIFHLCCSDNILLVHKES